MFTTGRPHRHTISQVTAQRRAALPVTAPHTCARSSPPQHPGSSPGGAWQRPPFFHPLSTKAIPMSVKQLFDLTGQVALVTGGSRGLGLQMAEALGEMGAKLAITARKADELAEAKKHLEGMGYEVLTVVNV
eukprot:gene42778-56862_t